MAVSFNPNVVIVGAGPVGLWTAVQTKLRDPSLQIVVLEKHSTYQRKHVLQLGSWCLRGAPDNPRMNAIVKQFREQATLSTQLIEESLAKLAQELNIQILTDHSVDQPQALKAQFPQAKVIVGADGAHSVVRKEIFGNELAVEKNLKFVVEVKYQVQGQGQRLNLVKEAYPTLKLMGAIAQEYVGKEKDGVTSITLRLFVN